MASGVEIRLWGGWLGVAMVLGKLPVPGRPTILITVGQGPTALAVGAGGGCLDVFTLIYPFFPLSPSLWETALYRLKYCLKGPLNPKQPTNQSIVGPASKDCLFENMWSMKVVLIKYSNESLTLRYILSTLSFQTVIRYLVSIGLLFRD